MAEDKQSDRPVGGPEGREAAAGGGERAKPAGGESAKPAAKKPAARKVAPKPKKPTVMETAPWEDELTARLKERFGDRIGEYAVYRGQKFLVARAEAVIEILEYLKLEADFDYLVDVTAVDYPKKERRFELVYIVYSFARNDRVRIKTAVGEGEAIGSAAGVHRTANWLEREVYDMFGVEFADHPDLKRILLPDDWEGHPLRKDKGIVEMDNQWVRDNIGIESGQ